MKKKYYKIDDYNFDLGMLLNDKATLEWKIDKDQKFVARTHHELGTEQFLYYKEEIERNQKELKEVTQKISTIKTKIQNYENAR
jgi:hypothetical protein